MKAWQINECDVYAGETLEEAIEASMRDTGNTQEETVGDYAGHEVDRAETVRLVEEGDGSGFTTVGALLDEMTKPGIVSSTEY